MANHVYFNVEVDDISEKEWNTAWKTELVKRTNWEDKEVEYQELLDMHLQPFLENVGKYELDEDGWLKDSYNWYCDNLGAKWVNVDDWCVYNGGCSGYSAWSAPTYMVENLLVWLSARFGREFSAKMTYEDEFRNFFGVDWYETYEEDGEWFCATSDEVVDGNELTVAVEAQYPNIQDEDGDWDWDVEDESGKTAMEYADDLVYAFFEKGEWRV